MACQEGSAGPGLRTRPCEGSFCPRRNRGGVATVAAAAARAAAAALSESWPLWRAMPEQADDSNGHSQLYDRKAYHTTWLLVDNEAEFRSKAADEGFKMGEITWEPHRDNPLHTHPFDIAVFLTKGSMTIDIGSQRTEFAVGECTALAAGTQHTETVGPEGVTFLICRRAPERNPYWAPADGGGKNDASKL